MTLNELVIRNRSYRRYHQNVMIPRETLVDLVNLARLTASAANIQPLKYILSCDPARNADIFRCLHWAAYLKDWPGPPEGERPSAYIVILGDRKLKESFGCDHGIAAQTILLGAVERELGGCIVATIDKATLQQAVNIPPAFEILLVIALGKPKEQVVIEPVKQNGDIRYWRDDQGIHHVPKRSLNEVIID